MNDQGRLIVVYFEVTYRKKAVDSGAGRHMRVYPKVSGLSRE
jgi:hypothetical protein